MGSTARSSGTDRRGDAVRLSLPHGTGLLDDPPYPSLDRLARTAAHQVRAARAQVTLADAERLVVLGSAGAAMDHSLCGLVVELDAPLLVGDARTDERVWDHPAVAEGVLAYAGFPLRTPDGYALGTFCVIDTRPRAWEPGELLLIEDLAAAAESEMALRMAAHESSTAARRLSEVLERTADAYVSIDACGIVESWNAAAERLFGYPAAEALGASVADLIIPARFAGEHTEALARLREGEPSTLAGQRLELSGRDRSGAEFPIEMTFEMIGADHGSPTFHAFLHDISDRVAEREQLEHERTFLQTLLDSLDTGVAACDAQGRLTLFNRAMRDIHRGDVRPIGAADWPTAFALYGPDGQAPLAAGQSPLARAFAGEQVHGQHIVVAPPGAGARDFHANARPMDTPSGRRLGAVVALHDVTMQYRAELLHRLQLGAARVLADATGAEEAANATVEVVARAMRWVVGEFWAVDDVIETISRVGHWVSPDRDFSAVTGDRPFTLSRGQGLAGHIWSTGADLWACEVADDPRTVARGDQVRAAGLRTAIGVPVRSDDRILGVLLFFSATLDERDDELIEALQGVCAHLGRYIERRRTEQLTAALAAARRAFDRVIAQVNDYVWTVVVATDGTLRPVFASPDGSGVFGEQLRVDGDLAAAMRGRVHPDDRASFEEFRRRLMAGDPAENEIRLVGADGVTRWVWTRAVPRTENGRLLIDGISTNVTERRQLAEQREQLLTDQREQNRRLRHLDRLKDELVALVSHELRNPLGVIRNYSETLLDDPGLTADQRHLAEVVDRRSAHMQDLVDDLLDMARLEAGQLHVEPRPTSAAGLIRDVLEAQRPAAQAKTLTVAVDVPPHLAVQADPVRLRQVLDNLLSNAIKYTPPGGRVTVTARLVLGEGGAAAAELTVSDTGIGIPAEQYPHLFDRFFRASNAVQQGIKGTGLGLAITRAIVEAHAGTISVAPAPGGGTSFTVVLPVA